MAYKQVARLAQATAFATALAVVSSAGVAVTANAADNGSQPSVDVLNWWTSASESKAMHILKQMLAKQGVKMKNDAVSGGGGANARTVLKSRLQAHNPPGMAQIKGPKIQQWCQTSFIGSLNKVAKSDNWGKKLAPRIYKDLQCNGKVVAAPFDIHRVNWLWVNRSVMKKAGASMPQTWSQLVTALKTLKKAGVTPIASGGDKWQIGTEFDAVVATVGNAKFYRKAFVDLDPSALSSNKMIEAFKRLHVLEKYTAKNSSGGSWNHDTSRVVHGKAAMQIMGDWAKGTITNEGDTPGKQIACLNMPGNDNAYIYDVDTFEAFKAGSKSGQKAQAAFARTVMTPKFQRRFNKVKGSIPVVKGVSLKGFDQCAQKSRTLYQKAKKANVLVPSMSQDMAEVGSVKGAIFDVIDQFYNAPNMSAKAAANDLTSQVKQAQRASKLYPDSAIGQKGKYRKSNR